MNRIFITSLLMATATLGAHASSGSSAAFGAWQDVFTTVAENTVNGVVSVKSFVSVQARQNYNQGYGLDPFSSDPFFQYFFGQPQTPQRRQQRTPQEPQEPKERQLGLGSGVIISKDGYIVTNHHVISDAERLEVTLNDNRTFTATVIGSDAVTDLALIRIDADSLHTIPMGDSDSLRVGQWVLAVGNPFGFTSSVTTGIVSAKARNISSMVGASGATGGVESYIQTDAAVNHGNSGGALVNMDGELVGINAAIYSNTGAYAGCSFAIPTSIVNKVVSDLKTYGTVQRAFLGIRFQEVTPELLKDKGLQLNAASGIYVASIEDGSAASDSDLAVGDVILSLGGMPTRNTAQLQEAIARCRPGDQVELVYVREGRPRTTSVTLRNRQGNTEVERKGQFDDLGATFLPAKAEDLKRLGLTSGLRVSDIKPDGLVAQSGIRDGFIITDINNSPMKATDDIRRIYKAIMESEDYDHVMFVTGIYPSTRKKAYYAIALE